MGRNSRRKGNNNNSLQHRLLIDRVHSIYEEIVDKPSDIIILVDMIYDILIQKHKSSYHQSRDKLLFQIDQIVSVFIKEENNESEDDQMSDNSPLSPNIDLVEYKDHNLLNSSLYSSYQETSKNTIIPESPTETNLKKRKLEKPTKEPDNKRAKISSSNTKVIRKSRPSASSNSDMSYSYCLPDVRYRDLGGIDELLADIRELIEWPLIHPELYKHIGISPPVGVLLHGPPGCGKTLLAQAIGGELGRPFYKISAPEIVSGMSGESEAKLRALFMAALNTAPSIIFIDEIDAIAPKRETAQREMEKRIVAQLLSCMDEISDKALKKGSVMVIGATNRPHVLDAALRRAGRFDRELTLGVPNLNARTHILKVLYSKLTTCGEFDFEQIGRLTPGFVGADLAALTKESAVVAINRIFCDINTSDISPNSDEVSSRTGVSNRLRNKTQPLTPEQLAPLSISMNDVLKSIKKVQPSAKREGFATVPNVTWNDVGALKNIREELNLAIVENIKQSSIFVHLGLVDPTGILLYGPPGCGKTLLAKAIANDANANFISVKGPELLNKYVGESEKAVRMVFQRARTSSPCIVFFDELDALCPKRSSDSQSHSSERVVNQLLTEMDGVQDRKNVYIIAATNRPDIIDSAMLRPGRLDKLIYVPLPTAPERKDILETLSKSKPIHSSVNMSIVAHDKRCERFSGADLSSLVREASLECLREYLKKGEENNNVFIQQQHFTKALAKIGPSVSKRDEIRYTQLRKKFASFKIKATNEEDDEIIIDDNMVDLPEIHHDLPDN